MEGGPSEDLEKMPIYKIRREALRRNQFCQHLELRLLSFKTVRQ